VPFEKPKKSFFLCVFVCVLCLPREGLVATGAISYIHSEEIASAQTKLLPSSAKTSDFQQKKTFHAGLPDGIFSNQKSRFG
jgi:hypothetical protein